jgi:hypothetical protein
MDMIDDCVSVTQSPKQAPKDVSKIVGESREMDFIRKALEEKGLEPIWATLITRFGALMYTRGRRSSVPTFRRDRLLSKKREKLNRQAAG